MASDLIDEESLDPASTARMARHLSVVAQIEAALLADRLALDPSFEPTGTDPYNQGTRTIEPWRSRQR